MGAVGPRGFTLIEILVVLVIVGIMMGLATVRFLPDDQATLTEEARRLAICLEQAHDQAVAAGEPIGFSVEAERYRFWSLDARNEWAPRDGDDVLKPRALTRGVRVRELSVNREPVAADERLLFLPAGGTSPFVMDLALNAAEVRLRGDRFGRVRVEFAGDGG